MSDDFAPGEFPFTIHLAQFILVVQYLFMRTLTSILIVISLNCACSMNDGDREELALLQQRIDKLEAGVRGAEAVRAVKRLQYAYGHYAEQGLWYDFADLFADSGIGHYPSGDLNREGIRRLFLEDVGKGKLGLSEGQLYPHFILQPVVTLDPGRNSAKGRFHCLALLGSYGGAAFWVGGVYENQYILENGVWKIKDLHYYSQYSGLYDQPGWTVDDTVIPIHYDPKRAGTPIADSSAQPISSESVTRSREILFERLRDLSQRAERLNDESEVENLQHIYGYYIDRKMWDDVADLFAEDGTMELGLRGVYVGKKSIRKALDQFGPTGLQKGELNDHLQLQTIVHVASDGRTAKARGVELGMLGALGAGGEWAEGIFENKFVKQNGIWKIQSLHVYTRLRTDYGKGWAKDARPAHGPNENFPADRPPTVMYEAFPKFCIAPFHFVNPVTGLPPQYPEGFTAADNLLGGKRSGAVLRNGKATVGSIEELAKGIDDAERLLRIAVAYDAAENLASAYGYYLDEFGWDEIADLFARDGRRDLGSIGVEVGRENIREALKRRYPGIKPKGFFTIHQLVQPVIHVASDGQSAKMRVRLFQLGGASGKSGYWIAGVYETKTIMEGGAWKYAAMDLDYTWTADYRGGWANVDDGGKGIIQTPFPEIIDLPSHYKNPVTGREPPVFVP
jgi:hypothetical protein